MDLLLRVFQADAGGRRERPDDSQEAASWLQAEAQRLEVTRTRPEAVLKGRHLLQRGWEAGPEMGRLLDQAYEAQLDGAFANLDEAWVWLADQGRPESPVTQPGKPKS